MSKTIEQACQDAICHLQKQRVNDRILERCKESFFDGAEFMKKEYEEKLRWTPIDELHNPTIPFLGKDKSGKIELFKVANVFYLKALDVVEWRSIL